MHRRASLKAPGGSRRDGGQRGNASHARGRYVRTETGPGERVFRDVSHGNGACSLAGNRAWSPIAPGAPTGTDGAAGNGRAGPRGRTGPRGRLGGWGHGDGQSHWGGHNGYHISLYQILQILYLDDVPASGSTNICFRPVGDCQLRAFPIQPLWLGHAS